MFFIPPFPLGGLGNLGTKRYKGKRKFKYTPSYEAFVLGIKGKAPKGIETGSRIRPITPGFSFGKSFGGLGSFGGLSNFSKLGNFNINPFRTKKSRKRRNKKR